MRRCTSLSQIELDDEEFELLLEEVIVTARMHNWR